MSSRLAPRLSGRASPDRDSRRPAAWLVGKRLNSGRFASVFRAAAANSSQGEGDFAIKIARCAGRDRRLAVALLRREVEVMDACRHPNLLAILDWQLTRPPYYHVSPYLEGNDLRDLIQCGPLPAGPSVWIARQISQALECLHGAGWLHGDVSSSNVRVASSGHATLLDLAFAQTMAIDQNAGAGLLTGNREYEPPEERQPSVRSAAGDVYGLGCLLQAMLLGPQPIGRPAPSPLDATRAELMQWIQRHLLAEDAQNRLSSSEATQQLVRWEIRTLSTCEILEERGTPSGDASSSKMEAAALASYKS